MKESDILIGKYIKVFTTTYEVDGHLQYHDKDKIILKNNNGKDNNDYFIVYKNHVIMVLIKNTDDVSSLKEEGESAQYDSTADNANFASVSSRRHEDAFPTNYLHNENQYRTIFPKNLLETPPYDPYDSILNDDVDLSVSFNTIMDKK
jgi:hypothetical protein